MRLRKPFIWFSCQKQFFKQWLCHDFASKRFFFISLRYRLRTWKRVTGPFFLSLSLEILIFNAVLSSKPIFRHLLILSLFLSRDPELNTRTRSGWIDSFLDASAVLALRPFEAKCWKDRQLFRFVPKRIFGLDQG